MPYTGIFARYVITPRHNRLPQIKSLSEFGPKDTVDTVPTGDLTTKKERADLDHGLTETNCINPGKGRLSSDNSMLELFGQRSRIRGWTLPKHKKCACQCTIRSLGLCYNVSSPLQTQTLSYQGRLYLLSEREKS